VDSAATLLQPVLMRTRGCPENNALWALRKAFADVCRQTECWRDSVAVSVSADAEPIGTDEERVRIPDPAYSARILRIHRALLTKSGSTVAADVPLSSFRVRRGESDWLVVRGRGTLEAGDSISLDVSLVPDEIGATLAEIPPGIVRIAGQAAEDLAVATLCNQSGRPWTDREASALAALDAANGIRRILADISCGEMDLPARTIPESPVEG
jgi:hypothetical protein